MLGAPRPRRRLSTSSSGRRLRHARRRARPGVLNPLPQAPIAEIKEFAKDKIQEAIAEDELHIDIDQLKSFVTSPYASGSTCRLVSLSSCPASGRSQLDLFEAGTPRAGSTPSLHLPADHHVDQQVTLPGVGTITSTRPQGLRRSSTRSMFAALLATPSRPPSCCCPRRHRAQRTHSATSSRRTARSRAGAPVNTYPAGSQRDVAAAAGQRAVAAARSTATTRGGRTDCRPSAMRPCRAAVRR